MGLQQDSGCLRGRACSDGTSTCHAGVRCESQVRRLGSDHPAFETERDSFGVFTKVRA